MFFESRQVRLEWEKQKTRVHKQDLIFNRILLNIIKADVFQGNKLLLKDGVLLLSDQLVNKI